MATTTATAALSMKLLIDRKAQRVLFAEASKELVDFVFSLLALPVATAVKLVGKEAMVGCVGNLYASVDKLDSNSSLLRLPAAPSSGQPKSYFNCGGGCNCVTDASGTACPYCRKPMQTVIPFVVPSSAQNASTATGGAKGFVTYKVLDDLTVTPMPAMTAISSITLLKTFAVRDLGDLQDTTVQLGYNEGLAILKASLQSKTVLTDVFLHGQAAAASAGGRA